MPKDSSESDGELSVMTRQVWQLISVDPNGLSGSIGSVDSGDIMASDGFSRLQLSSSMVLFARCFANKP